MKLSIRMKIFLPVMFLLIAFPVAAWFVFSYALDADIHTFRSGECPLVKL